MAFCTYCGKEIAENINFCPECGASIDNTETTSRIGTANISNDAQTEEIKINNLFAEGLALVPIVPFLIGLIIGNADESVVITIQCIWTLVFLVLEYYNLKKAGINVKEGWVYSLLITPFYLFLRGKKIDKNYKYFIIWCVAFALNYLMIFLFYR